MEMNLQPPAPRCAVTGRDFVEDERVASFLIRPEGSAEILRQDVAESELAAFQPAGQVVCRWVRPFKPRKEGENPERELKLTAESLFLSLADPATEPTVENDRLVQVLALMLERKKVLRPKGPTADRKRNVFEHAKTKQLFEVPAAELSPEFFLSIQEQLAALVGGGKKPAPAEAAVEAAGAQPAQ